MKKTFKNTIYILFFLSIFALGALVGDGLTDEKEQADVIVVFGNTVHENGEPSERLKARLETASKLYTEGYADAVIVSGALGKEGHNEALVMGVYLEEHGIDTTDIFVDPAGVDTYHTAKYTQKKMKEKSWDDAIVVSDYFHIPRAKFALKQFGVEDVYGVHADNGVRVRDLYAIPRELFALVAYASKQYETDDVGDVLESDAAEKELVQVIALPLKEITVSVVEGSEIPKRVSEWAREVDAKEYVVINGAYFLENNEPAGYLVVDGQEISSRMFDQDKSGMLVVEDGTVDIRDLSVQPFDPDKEHPEFALQSYPFIIRDGTSAIDFNSGNTGRRTAIGIDDVGEYLYIFTVTNRAMSLYDFMQEIEKLQLPLKHVLNLDGGTSTGIVGNWHDEKIQHDSFVPVPNVVVIEKIQ